MNKKALALEWEKRWAIPVAVATVVAVVLLIASVPIGSTLEGNDGLEYLQSINDHHSAVIATNTLQGVGLLLLVFPVLYLFRAVGHRQPRFRSQFIGVIIVAPIFLAAASVLNGISLINGANDFFAHVVPEGASKANDAADDARNNESLRPLVFGLSLGGLLGFAFSLLYIGLNALRTGLLSRFWGSLGMAVGILMIFIGPIPIAVIWFLYMGLLYAGIISRPPAWATGEAIPWPTPGEQMAAQMDPRSKPDHIEGEGTDITPDPDDEGPAEPKPDEPSPDDSGPISARELGEIDRKDKRPGR